VNQFRTVKEAKDYLAGRIAAEATREGAPLSEIERKMLYFSETDWTLPDMAEVSAEFDREYDQDEYERKIGGLIREITSRDHSQSQTDTEAWDEAVVKLSEGDHYLSVLVNPSLLPGPAVRPPHDILKLWITGFGALLVALTSTAVLSRILGARFWDDDDWLSFHRFGGLLVLAPVVALMGIAVRRRWIVIGRRK
jgi:hypothetical protein